MGLVRMNCKTCDNGLRPEEEEAEQCLFCADKDREWSLEESDKHCPTCRCNEEV